jgi:hypothetical protein
MLSIILNTIGWITLVLTGLAIIFKLTTKLQTKRPDETALNRVWGLIFVVFDFIIVYQFLFGR